MDEVLKHINVALKRKGLSDAAASMLAVGNQSLLKNMKASSATEEKRYSFQALQRLANVLDLECYFGPPRGGVGAFHESDAPEYKLTAGVSAPPVDRDGSAPLVVPEPVISGLLSSRLHLQSWQQDHDGMAPVISIGDLVVVDRSLNDPLPVVAIEPRAAPPMYLCEIYESRLIARAVRPDSTNFLLTFDNPAYQPALRRVTETRILGRVVWWAHTEV